MENRHIASCITKKHKRDTFYTFLLDSLKKTYKFAKISQIQ